MIYKIIKKMEKKWSIERERKRRLRRKLRKLSII
jgi:DNA-binding PadR family transcriptional regulator